MLVRVDSTSSVPLYSQIERQIRRAIADGEVHPGERLPNARDLATSLDVNLQTVLRSYAGLRDEGLVEVRRRRGVTVIATPDTAELVDLAIRLVASARSYGLSDHEIHDLVEVNL